MYKDSPIDQGVIVIYKGAIPGNGVAPKFIFADYDRIICIGYQRITLDTFEPFLLRKIPAEGFSTLYPSIV